MAYRYLDGHGHLCILLELHSIKKRIDKLDITEVKWWHSNSPTSIVQSSVSIFRRPLTKNCCTHMRLSLPNNCTPSGQPTSPLSMAPGSLIRLFPTPNSCKSAKVLNSGSWACKTFVVHYRFSAKDTTKQGTGEHDKAERLLAIRTS